MRTNWRDRLRLELYRRLSQVESLKEIYEIASEMRIDLEN